MKRSTPMLSALAAVGLIAGSLVAAAPATAVPSDASSFPGLAAGDTLFGFDCDSTSAVYDIAVTADSAIATPIGDVVGFGGDGEGSECTGGVAWNPVDGYVYGILWPGQNNQMFDSIAEGNYLVKADPATGVQTIVGEFTGDVACTDPWALAIDNDGVAYMTDGGNWCSVNLTDATATEIQDDVFGGVGEPSDYALGYDWTTDTMYMFSANYEIWTIDVATGAGTLFTTLAASDTDYDCGEGNTDDVSFDASAGFDSNGIAWIQGDTCESMPIAWNPATGDFWYTGIISVDVDTYNTDEELVYPAGSEFYIEGFTVVPGAEEAAAPELAETGVASGAAGTSALIGAGLMLAGAVAWMARRRMVATR